MTGRTYTILAQPATREPTLAEVRELLTLADIGAWLDAQPRSAVVGECRCPGRCLLANYLWAKTGRLAYVTGREACLRSAADDRTLFCVRLAPEVGQLVDAFDSLGEPGDQVLASEARALVAALASAA